MIPAKTVTLLTADGGTGKSLVALQLSVATVAGLPWFGIPVQRGGALFVTAEDDIDEVHRRLADIVAAMHLQLDGLAALTLSSLAGHDAILAATDHRTGLLATTALYMALRVRVATERPALLILDTQADLFGGEENNRAHVRQFVGLLRTIAIEFDVAVVLIAHPSLTGIASGSGLSGSTAWNNSVRSRLYMKRDAENSNVRVLETMKSNYGATGQQIKLHWQNGAFVRIDASSNNAAIRVAEDFADVMFLQMLDDFTSKSRDVSPNPASKNYAPRVFAKLPNGKPHGISQFEAAMERHFQVGRIRVAMSNTSASRQTQIIVRGDGA